MQNVARIIGGAGTGKTTRLLQAMDKLIARGYDPREIGFVTFTRAARAEASSLAAAAFNLRAEDLEVGGWFRTIHSIAYKQLGIAGDELITDNRQSLLWIQEAVGESISRIPGEDGDIVTGDFDETRADYALRLWSLARSRLTSLKAEYDRDPWYGWEIVSGIVDRYEQAKRLDGCCDFTDLVARFAGIRFVSGDPIECAPEGDLPPIRVLFADEQQDSSALLDRATRRLAENVDYAYLCLDPWQSIYGFAGASASHALTWPVQPHNEHVLPKSHRCPAPILSLGEEILRDCSDYWDRGIAPADHDGEIDDIDFRSCWADEIDPRESWLLIARSNYHVRRIAGRLNHAGIPWVPTKGNGGWRAPARNAAIRALRTAQQEHTITETGWQAIVKQLPRKAEGAELLVRGAKTQATKLDGTADRLLLGTIGRWGATEALLERILTGRWALLIKGAEEWNDAARLWGDAAADVDGWKKDQGVRVGTIHSAKGAESDSVLLLATTSSRVHRSTELTADGEDAERRVAYVAVTRAKRRLLVAREPNPYRMEIPT